MFFYGHVHLTVWRFIRQRQRSRNRHLTVLSISLVQFLWIWLFLCVSQSHNTTHWISQDVLGKNRTGTDFHSESSDYRWVSENKTELVSCEYISLPTRIIFTLSLALIVNKTRFSKKNKKSNLCNIPQRVFVCAFLVLHSSNPWTN